MPLYVLSYHLDVENSTPVGIYTSLFLLAQAAIKHAAGLMHLDDYSAEPWEDYTYTAFEPDQPAEGYRFGDPLRPLIRDPATNLLPITEQALLQALVLTLRQSE